MKKGFTIVEMVIVVIVIGLMIAMIPFRMRSLQEHTAFSIVTNQREDFWQKNILRIRQGNKFPQAVITLSISGGNILFTGSSTLPSQTVDFSLPENVKSSFSGMVGEWYMSSYGLSCDGYTSGFTISMGRYRKCYQVDISACTLKSIQCIGQ